MKKTLLASALFVGISAYAAIPSDINERAELVQQRNDTITANLNKAYQYYLQANPMLSGVDIQLRNYTRSDNGATDQTVIALDWNDRFFDGEEPPVKELIFNSTIDYSDAVAQAGKLAVMTGELDAVSLAKTLEFAEGSDDFKALKEIVQHLELTTTLLDDDKLEQLIRIKPFDVQSSNGSRVAYEGFDYTIKTTDKALERGYGDITMRSGKFELNDTQESNKGVKKLVLMPFAGEGEYKENGDMNFDMKPLEIQIDDLIIKAKNFEMKGKDIEFDPVLAGYLGHLRYTVNSISAATADKPEAEYIKSITFTADNEKSGDLYKSEGQLEVLPVSESFSALTGGMSEALGIKSLTIDGKVDKISAAMLAEITEIQTDFQVYAAAGSDPEKQEAAKKLLIPRVDAVLAEAGKHGALFKGKVELNTEPGKATLEGYVEVLKGSTMTYAELEAAGQAESPAPLMQLLNKNVRFEADIVIPKALVDVVGGGAFLEDSPLQLDGKNYKLNIKNSDKGITINDQMVPM